MTRYESQTRPECYKRCNCSYESREHCSQVFPGVDKCNKCKYFIENLGRGRLVLTRYSKQECGIYVGKKFKDATTKWTIISTNDKLETSTVKSIFGNIIRGIPFSRIMMLSKKFGTWE